jgi:hypothetical protein
MTKAKLKSLSDKKIAEVLYDFLLGKLPFQTLKTKLDGLITFDFNDAPEHREIHDLKIDEKIQFPVKGEYLCKMLQKYVSGEISDLEVSNWAAVIYETPYYIPDGNTEEERWQEGKGPIWEVIQKLITPSIYGGLDIEVAKTYMSQLKCDS